MKETHFAYKIMLSAPHLLLTFPEIEEASMLELLKIIQMDTSEGIYWVFKQIGTDPKMKLCIVDSPANKIYYHYSGAVEALDETINRLNS